MCLSRVFFSLLFNKSLLSVALLCFELAQNLGLECLLSHIFCTLGVCANDDFITSLQLVSECLSNERPVLLCYMASIDPVGATGPIGDYN